LKNNKHHKGENTMNKQRIITTFSLLAAAVLRTQAQTGSILTVEVRDETQYITDCANSQIARNPNRLDRQLGPAFEAFQGIGDIVSVNGMPMKGTAFENVLGSVISSPNAASGSAVADVSRAAIVQWLLDFINPDGTELGTILISGLGGGMAPPGAPKAVLSDAMMVTGGSGAFLGVRGYFHAANDPATPPRRTSACEDPSRRHINNDPGRGARHVVLYLVPATAPAIVMTANGPAVVHSADNSLVTPDKPAQAGEVLTLFATGLGPTRPGVDPGQPFPSDAPQPVNSPVQVTVNGTAAEVLYAGGYPGAVDGFQVNFRVPDGTSGSLNIQVGAAGIMSQASQVAGQ
jgi:hypothetical protein